MERFERRGVEAIFSTQRDGVDARFFIGVLVAVIGVILCSAVGLESQFPGLFEAQIGFYLSVLLSSLGTCLVFIGAGICRSYSTSSAKSTASALHDVDSTTVQERRTDHEIAPLGPREAPDLRGRVVVTRNMRFGILAFIQTCIVLALYSGLADEYRSNSSMQLWIRSKFPLAQYFLTWWTALIIAAVLGILIVQFLPGRRFAR